MVRDARRDNRSGRRSRRPSRREDDLFHDLNRLFVEDVENQLDSQRGLLSNRQMGDINIFLFSRLSTEAKRRSSELVINPDRNDFALRLRININSPARSRVTQVDRTSIHEKQSDVLEQFMKNASSGIDNLDSVSDVIDRYCETYLTIEDGIENFFNYLTDNGYTSDEVISVINSAEIYYEYGEFIIFPTAKWNDREGVLDWSLRYETSGLIKQTIKNDFSFNGRRRR
jgi:hypothetical protein